MSLFRHPSSSSSSSSGKGGREGEENKSGIQDAEEDGGGGGGYDSDSNPDRGHWSNPCDFFVSCLGYAVGLGNVWRFPFLCYQHGGGSFLVSYLLMLFSAGLPIFLLEIYLGQYTGMGPVKIFASLTPLLSGLGYAMVTVSMLLSFFYIVVVSWALWYLFASLWDPLEWGRCGHDYNTPNCVDAAEDTGGGANASSSFANGTSSVEEFWTRNVLQMQGRDWSNYGYPRWQPTLALFLSWSLVCLCLLKGIRSSGKVSYFTSAFPYLVLGSLAVRSLSLPGADMGLRQYITPKWERMLKLDIWVDSATQVIFSLGPACGCVVTLSSYNSFRRNCHLDAVCVAAANAATSVCCGAVVFAVLGFMSHKSGLALDRVAVGGPGLAFVVYPEVVLHMGAGAGAAQHGWAAAFFLMLVREAKERSGLGITLIKADEAAAATTKDNIGGTKK